MFRACWGFAAWLAIVGLPPAAHGQWTVEKTPAGATVKFGGKLVAEYITRSGTKPILWPLIGPTQKPVTRAYPMDEKVPGEAHDHLHQRSCWFTYGDVNGIDFWAEPKTAAVGTRVGTIEHKDFVELAGGPDKAVVETTNDWLGPDGSQQCSDRRRFEFRMAGDQRIIDCDITLTAPDRPVVFGDTKEGAFGLRVAQEMALTSNAGGEIVNSHGDKNGDAWGKPAEWVDYHGPVDPNDDAVVGIAILNHPASFHYPTRWHVRDYGLFAANPFGRKEFPGGGEGGHTLPPRGELKLYYRMILHKDDEQAAGIAKAYERYAKEQRP
ncbi:MAG TPA: PmoA family protein [Pirellulales bacterium]|nr:PmoA family protein [Pirellulales bacterium]